MSQIHAMKPNEDNREKLPLIQRRGVLLSQSGRDTLSDPQTVETSVMKTITLSSQYQSSRSRTCRLVIYPPMGGRTPLVIPGGKVRSRETEALHLQNKPLHPLLRFGLLFLSFVGILLICMLTLTPMGEGPDSKYALSWVRVSRSEWNVLSSDSMHDGINVTANLVSYYQGLAQTDAFKYGISPSLYVRQIQQESHFDPYAYSYAGAIGIAQFVPGTAAQYHIDPRDPVQALDAGAHYMSDLTTYFHGDYRKALAGYNAGQGAVDRAVAACGAAWLSCMDGQPQAYVMIIMGY
jgi:hypothetical protein